MRSRIRIRMTDRELVTRKMVLIIADLRALEPLAQRPVEDYVASQTDEILVERYLERIIGRMIDINYHSSMTRPSSPRCARGKRLTYVYRPAQRS